MVTMRALILDAAARTAAVQVIPQPTPGQGEVRVRVSAVALNPVDALYVAHPLGQSGRVVGSDFAGVVESTPDSSPDALQPGQRVAGFLQGACSANDRPGAFAEALVVPGDLVWRVPDVVSDHEAAAISLCGLTAAQAVFYRLGLPAPFSWEGTVHHGEGSSSRGSADKELCFFIYGATTSVGLYAAQLVRRSSETSGRSLKLIGAASPAHFAMLQAAPYGYDALVNYRDVDWPAQVRALTSGRGADYAYDGISESRTVAQVSTILRPGGRLAIVRSREAGAWQPDGLVPGVEPIYGAVWEGLGEEVQYHKLTVAASARARAFAAAFYRWLSEGGELKANPVRRMPGGLDRIVEDGFALLGTGSMDDREQSRNESWMRRVSAEKLVYDLGGVKEA